MKNLITILYVSFFFLACSVRQEKYQMNEARRNSPNILQEDVQLFHVFKSNEGQILGFAYVSFMDKLNENLFTSLTIVDNHVNPVDTLYFIGTTKFIGKNGTDLEFIGNEFYGYKIMLLKPDYIVIALVDENGEAISDNVTVEWNYSNKSFEMLKTP
jgi:hypothetical protein